MVTRSKLNGLVGLLDRPPGVPFQKIQFGNERGGRSVLSRLLELGIARILALLSMRPGDHDRPSLRRPVVSFPDYKNTTITLEFKTLSYTPFYRLLLYFTVIIVFL